VNSDQLYALLPAVYRLRDAERDGALRQLLDVVAGQLEVLGDSIDQFYDDQFVETCADWVVPYIGDLVGYRPLHGVVASVASPRAEVANTIRYRRRKGTAAMLQQLARDVTGWPARAVEFFDRLTGTQYMNHYRRDKGGPADLRRHEALGWIGTGFDDLPHTAEMRRIATGAGRYNIPNVGLFLWRVAAVPLVRVPLTPVPGDATGRRFRVDQLGLDEPIYGPPSTVDEITSLARPADVPLPLSRRYLSDHLAEYYGAAHGLLLEVLGGSAPATTRVCDLSDVGGGWAHEPAPGSDTVALDPVLGRVWFSDAPSAGTPVATYHYGSALRLGAGGHDRGDPAGGGVVPAQVSGGAAVQPALDAAAGGGIVELVDSWRYDETPAVAVDADATLTLRAANRQRPLLAATGPVHLNPGPRATVVLDGLLLSGGAVVLDEQTDTEPRTIVLRDCTLVPAATAALIVLHPFATVHIERCQLGPVVAVDGATVSIVDSVVDATDRESIAYAGRAEPAGGGRRTVTGAADEAVGDGLTAGAALTLDAVTVVGRVHALRLDVSDSIAVAAVPTGDPWPGPVWADRRQVGCVRYSYVPPGSRTGPRYHCQPTGPGILPQFTSLRFGDPGYGQLRLATPDAIRRGADDEGELGAGHYLYQPQRESNLRTRLDEYLRFGLEAGIFYAS
jgi:hypothetical protein